jgi:hypothetical protein
MEKKELLSVLILLPSIIICIFIAYYWGTHAYLTKMQLFLKFWYLWAVMFVDMSIFLWVTL